MSLFTTYVLNQVKADADADDDEDDVSNDYDHYVTSFSA